MQGTARLFSDEASGLLVQLPGWQYPVVVDTGNGTVRYDNYNGRWGEQEQLDRMIQMYAVEKAAIEARKRGYSVSEQALQDGSIRLQIRAASDAGEPSENHSVALKILDAHAAGPVRLDTPSVPDVLLRPR